jgi:hypothetical protein
MHYLYEEPGSMTAFEQHPLVIPWTRLPFVFDPQLLRSDVATISDDAWVAHFNQADYTGQWSSVALRSKSGDPRDIIPTGSASEFSDTPLMGSCHHLRYAIESFQFPKKSVRLLRLHPGSYVKDHVDRDLGLAGGEIRIHIPVETNDHVEFIVANRLLPLRAGESWYIDFSQPHRIRNDGITPRTHLVIDGTLNDWTRDMLIHAKHEIVTTSFDPPGIVRLDEFRQAVYSDSLLRSELLKITDVHTLLKAVLVVANERGYNLNSGDIEAVYQQSRREWAQRSKEL